MLELKCRWRFLGFWGRRVQKCNDWGPQTNITWLIQYGGQLFWRQNKAHRRLAQVDVRITMYMSFSSHVTLVCGPRSLHFWTRRPRIYQNCDKNRLSLTNRSQVLHDNDHYRKYVIFKVASGICGRHIGQTREDRLPVLVLFCSQSIFWKSHQDASLYL